MVDETSKSKILKNFRHVVLKFIKSEPMALMAISVVLFLMGAMITPTTFLYKYPTRLGDSLGHFNTFLALHDYGLPHFQIRTWNPGIGLGDYHLLHYFPTPFIIMCFLSLFMVIGVAYNLGIVLPIFMFPVSVLWGLRAFGWRSVSAILGALFAYLAVFSELTNKSGGNSVSTINGQFCHMYALNFLFVFIGVLAWELRHRRKIYLSSILLAAIATSHSYVLIVCPFIMLGLIFHQDRAFRLGAFKYVFKVGLGGLLLSAWFLWPQFAQSKWMATAGSGYWEPDTRKLIGETTVLTFAVLVGFIFSPIILFLPAIKRKINWIHLKKQVFFWGIPLAVSFALVPILPLVNLISFRMLYHLVIFTFILAALFVGAVVEQMVSRWQKGVLLVAFALSLHFVANHSLWFKSGLWLGFAPFSSSVMLEDVKTVSKALSGKVSEPRVLAETASEVYTAGVGSSHLWLMLVLMSNRAVSQNLYVESSLSNITLQYLQSTISYKALCMLKPAPCMRDFQFAELKKNLQLLGIKNVIVASPEAKELAKNNSDLELITKTEFVDVYQLKAPVTMVDLVQTEPEKFEMDEYRSKFLKWHFDWAEGRNPSAIISAPDLSKPLKVISSTASEHECHPNILSSYDRIELTTNCPGFLHTIKYGYHPTWESESGEQIWSISPGFLAIVPGSSKVVLTAGHSLVWNISSLISWLALGAVLINLSWLAFRRLKR